MPSPFQKLQRQSPVALTDKIWTLLAEHYQQAHRHYHSPQHLNEMAAHWQQVAAEPGWQDPRSSWLALLFHDVVYDPMAAHGQNEAQSAALLADLLPNTDAAQRLILLTATHGTATGEPLGGDAALFLDCDLAILSADPDRFQEYERQIAAEYVPFVGAEAFRVGRAAFLQKLRNQPRLFHSDRFHQRFDAAARRNLDGQDGA
jgi:predicted metal-dependent HD superfamily phosphohydrolase